MANKFHDFDEPINRIGTDSFKWDYEGENGKYIPLGIADTDFKAPEEAIAAVRKLLQNLNCVCIWCTATGKICSINL